MYISWTDAVARLTSRGWGADHESMEAAERALVVDPAKLAGFGILELLCRLQGPPPESREWPLEPLVLPENAKVFPDKAIGDQLFFADDLEDGVIDYLIIGIDEESHCMIIAPKWSLERPPIPCFGCDWHYGTVAEALATRAKADIDYCEPEIKRARAALAAVEAGEDLERFTWDAIDKANAGNQG